MMMDFAHTDVFSVNEDMKKYMKFLFWNTNNNKKINNIIWHMVQEFDINIVILAEYADDINHLLKILEANNIYMGKCQMINCKKLIIIGNVLGFSPGPQDDRFSFQIIQDKYILCAVHLNSRIYSEQQDRRKIIIGKINEYMQKLEKDLETDYTILVGDLNDNPYDQCCLSASYLHGLPTKEDARRKSRTIEGRSFPIFYNPMWNFFGDFTYPPGTYYYENSIPVNSFWHILDQVMIRPSLIDSFVDKSLNIITETCDISLLNGKGRPDMNYSDHLPIMFEIKEDKNE